MVGALWRASTNALNRLPSSITTKLLRLLLRLRLALKTTLLICLRSRLLYVIFSARCLVKIIAKAIPSPFPLHVCIVMSDGFEKDNRRKTTGEREITINIYVRQTTSWRHTLESTRTIVQILLRTPGLIVSTAMVIYLYLVQLYRIIINTNQRGFPLH